MQLEKNLYPLMENKAQFSNEQEENKKGLKLRCKSYFQTPDKLKNKA